MFSVHHADLDSHVICQVTATLFTQSKNSFLKNHLVYTCLLKVPLTQVLTL